MATDLSGVRRPGPHVRPTGAAVAAQQTSVQGLPCADGGDDGEPSGGSNRSARAGVLPHWLYRSASEAIAGSSAAAVPTRSA